MNGLFEKLIGIAKAFDGNDVEYVADTKFKKTITVKQHNGDVLISILNTENDIGSCIRCAKSGAYWLYYNDCECSVEGCIAFVKDDIIRKAIDEIEHIVELVECGIDSDYTLKHMKKRSMNNGSFKAAYDAIAYQKEAYRSVKPFWM